MADPNPAQGMPVQFEKYWSPAGAGGNLIQWDSPGDFMRCVHAINAKITEHGGKPLPDHEIKGLCAKLHKKFTGGSPGHGPKESKMGNHK